MSTQTITIWRTRKTLYEGDHETFAKAVVDAVASDANLSGANLRGADYRGRKWDRAPLIKAVTGAPWAFGEDGEPGKYWIGCKCKTLDEWEAHFANPEYHGSVNETWRKLYMIELRAMDEQVKILEAEVSIQKGVAV